MYKEDARAKKRDESPDDLSYLDRPTIYTGPRNIHRHGLWSGCEESWEGCEVLSGSPIRAAGETAHGRRAVQGW